MFNSFVCMSGTQVGPIGSLYRIHKWGFLGGKCLEAKDGDRERFG
jgi:hypothetical protein